MQFQSSRAIHTKKIASDLAKQTPPGATILVSGEMGAGKTHFIQGFIEEKIKNQKQMIISSPTYTLRQAYTSLTEKIIHYDCYRLPKKSFLECLDEDLLDNKITTLIEWSENIQTTFPKKTIQVMIHKKDKNNRDIIISSLIL
jgi:tRNA threonylcarbamoyladenosine biosynthesis protein TsaE